MPEIDQPFIVLVAVVLALFVSLAASRIAMRASVLLDAPNERSSHTHHVSRAGGLAILIAIAAGYFILAAFSGDVILSGAAQNFLAVTALAGAVGLADDHLQLGAIVKFLGQLAVALVFVLLVGPLESAPIPFVGEVDLGWFGYALTVFWLTAFMNAFNFMDGVNGIAGGVAVVGLFFLAVIGAFAGAPVVAALAIVAAFAVIGFLPTNVFRGRLFMGDCGSHLLAFLIAGIGVYAANQTEGRISALVAPVIFLPFIFDVAFTLAHRLARGQRVASAHREHLYQIILRRGATHSAVAALYAGLTAFCAAAAILMLAAPATWQWLFPVALGLGFLILAIRLFRLASAEHLLSPRAQRE